LLGLPVIAASTCVIYASRHAGRDVPSTLMTAKSEYDNDDAQAKLARYVARGTEAMATVRALIENLEAKGILSVADGAEIRQRAAEIDRELRDTP
jgi:hypothetical protein